MCWLSLNFRRIKTGWDLHWFSVWIKLPMCLQIFWADEEWWTFVFLLWYILMLTEADQGELTKRGASVSHDLCAGGHRWILLMLSSSSKSLRPSLHHPWVEQSHSPRFLIFLVKALDLTSTRPWHAEAPISWNHEIMKIMKIMIGVQKCQKVD
jgi:hypothetical protein